MAFPPKFQAPGITEETSLYEISPENFVNEISYRFILVVAFQNAKYLSFRVDMTIEIYGIPFAESYLEEEGIEP